jgi:hypothetical protein
MRYLWVIPLISAATLPVLLGMSSAGVAQPSDSQPRLSDDGPPPGGCTPIGITVSGEIVFPLTCKDFIERHKAADRASSAAETKPATAEANKAPDAAEAGKAPATAEAGKAPTAVEASKALTTGEASSAPAAVEAGKAPTAPESGKPDEKDAKPAAAKAPADEADPPVAKQAAIAPSTDDSVKSSAEPATTAALAKRTRARNRVAGSPGCTRFRTYDAASRTYRDYGGHRRSCP